MSKSRRSRRPRRQGIWPLGEIVQVQTPTSTEIRVLPGGGIEFSVPNAPLPTPIPSPQPTRTPSQPQRPQGPPVPTGRQGPTNLPNVPAPYPDPSTTGRGTINPLDVLPGGGRNLDWNTVPDPAGSGFSTPGTRRVPASPIIIDDLQGPPKQGGRVRSSVPSVEGVGGSDLAFVPPVIPKPIPLPGPVITPGAPIPPIFFPPGPSNPPGGDRIIIPRPGEREPVPPVFGPPEMKGPIDTRPPRPTFPPPVPTPQRGPVPIPVPLPMPQLPPSAPPVEQEEPTRRVPSTITSFMFGQGYYSKRYPTRKVKGTGL